MVWGVAHRTAHGTLFPLFALALTLCLRANCYIFFSPRSSATLIAPLSLLSHPRHSQGLLYSPSSLSLPCPRLPSPPFALILETSPSAPTPSHLIPSPVLPPTPLNTEPLRSMDLPWISPGSPLCLTDTHLRVFPSFPSPASLVSPSSPHPCFSVTLSCFYL